MTGSTPIDLLPLQPVVDRLKANCPSLREVGVAADLAALLKSGAVRASPSAFVLLESAVVIATTEDSAPLRQTFEVTVAVLLAALLPGLKGEAAIRALAEPQAQIRGAMFAWSQPDTWRRYHFGAEGVEDFNDQTGVLLYRQNFTTQVQIQEA